MNILLPLVLFTSVATAGMWSTVTSMNLKEKKADAVYTLDTAGFNPRVYEFTTVDKKMKCVLVSASSNENSSPALQCIKLK